MLERESCRYILSVFWKKPILGCAWCDVSTGEFVVDQIKADGIAQALEQVVGQLDPAEIITDDATYLAALPTLSQIKAMVTTQGAWNFSKQNAEESLLKQFHQPSIKELGLEKLPVGVQAAGALSTYLIQTQKVSLLHINRLQKADDANIMMLDKSTKRNLELTQPMMGSGKKGTLFGVLDKTRTAQGSGCSSVGSSSLCKMPKPLNTGRMPWHVFLSTLVCVNRFGIVWTRYTIWNAFAARSRIRR